MKIYNCIVVGAGAAGMYFAARNELENVILIERNSSIGKKIEITGGGACNITHDTPPRGFYDCYGDKKSFVKKALYNHNSYDVMKYLNSIGLDLTIQDDKRVFPSSRNSIDVIKALHRELKDRVELHLSERVIKVTYSYEKQVFEVVTDKLAYETNKLVLATGGMSYAYTGSTGDGYDILKELGHEIVPTSPALTSVNTYEDMSRLSGISIDDVELKLKNSKNHQKINTVIGTLLFTHMGLSGPMIINNSRYMDIDDIIELNLVGISVDKLNSKILELTKKSPRLSVVNICKHISIANKIFEYILDKLQVKSSTVLSELKKDDRNAIIKSLTQFRVKIKRLSGYNNAMVTSGGADISQFNSATMESKFIKGLYVVGELLDIDGDTGGYNIQWAFSSAEMSRLSVEKQ